MRRHAPPVSVLGDAEELAHRWWRLLRLGAAEAEAVEDRPDGHLVGDEDDEPDFVELVRRAVQAAGTPH
jgi:hypothetical protein